MYVPSDNLYIAAEGILPVMDTGHERKTISEGGHPAAGHPANAGPRRRGTAAA